jgi:dCMP deaminase
MLELARVASTRGTCAKKQVGAVAVDDYGMILAICYNGQPRGYKHCTREDPCPAAHDTTLSCEAIHAEMNVLIRCNPDKIYRMYITEEPCQKCLLLIKNTSCQRIMTPNREIIL